MNGEICVVLTTCPNRESAEQLAAALVEQRLAACVSISAPALSIYPWQGRVEREQELPLTIKTSTARLGALEEALVEQHPYEVPEFLVLPIAQGRRDYVQWIRDWVE